jgi:mannose-1-phosphate guanylyltransferase
MSSITNRTNYYGLILAGGRGTRFWPRSRKARAKQVLNFFGERSLIQQTVDRLRPLLPPERIWILTNEHLKEEISRQLPEVPKRQIIAEPAQRNTAPAIGLACHMLHSLDPGAVLGIFPADHLISRPAIYLRAVRPAFRAASQGEMVVLGIKPRYPETGFGYIEFPKKSSVTPLEPTPIARFREKPDLATAKKFVKAGNYFWNAGMFFWQASRLLEALDTLLPKTAKLIRSLPPFLSPDFFPELNRVFPLCEDISIDYAVLEKEKNVLGVQSPEFGWNDVGSWSAVYDLQKHDAQGNAFRGDAIFEDSTGNYVDAPGKLVALVGARNLVVVDTPDALLVVDRDKAQNVSQLVKLLEKQRRDSLL